MVTHSNKLVQVMRQVLDALSWNDRDAFNIGLIELHKVCITITQTLAEMWRRSNAKDFARFRTFIMGTYNQPMFPNGVIYEGISSEGIQYRGASGAMDSLVPSIDNFLQITNMLPVNPLTEVLMDFRKYRPQGHIDFLNELTHRVNTLGLMNYAKQDQISLVYYIQNLDIVREFRMIHWNLTREYVLKYSAHPVATGGSPILSWLPNQLMAVLELMLNMTKEVDILKLDDKTKELYLKLQKTASAQDRILKREIAEIQKKCDELAMKTKK